MAVLAGLFLASVALRPQLLGATPLLPDIAHDLNVSHAVAGLLGTIPVACMGVFAFVAPWLSARLGTRVALGGCLAAIAIFGLLRAAAPGAPLVLTLTLPIGIGMGVAGALLPVAVKERFPHRPAFASGVYATGMHVGAASASALAVPVAAAWSGWRSSLALISACTLVCLVGWLALMPRDPAVRGAALPPRSPLPWRRRVVWAIAVVFGLQSSLYYGLNSWLPDAFQENGWTEETAGALLAVMALAGLVGGFVIGFLADRAGSRRRWLAAASGSTAVATIGFAALPDLGWVWAVVGGAGLGSLFPLVLTLPLDVADRPGEVGAVVSLVLGAGYAIGATSPLLLGAVRDATGSFSVSLWALVAIALTQLTSVTVLSPRRLAARAREPGEPA